MVARTWIRLSRCDVLVAEASGSSYGVGFEVGYILGRARATGQRVVLPLRRGAPERDLQAGDRQLRRRVRNTGGPRHSRDLAAFIDRRFQAAPL